MQNRERKIFKIIIYSALILTVLFFAIFQSKNLIAGPKIIMDEPLNGKIYQESLVKISGKASNVSEIKLNGRNIFIDEEGLFEEEVLLSYGYNMIILEAKDRFDRKTKKELKLVFK